MAGILNEKLFVPVTLPAAMRLLEMFRGSRLYQFVHFWDSAWFILPQHAIASSIGGWSREDQEMIDAWLDSDRGFRAFMFPEQLKMFEDPFVDLVDGKLVLCSGKKDVIPLD